MNLQHLNPSREESHQGRALSKVRVQKDHNREDPRNRVRAPLGRGQNQGKDPLGRDPGKVRDHQARGPNQVRVLLAKVPLGRDQGKVRGRQARGPNQARVLLAKDPQGSRVLNQVKDHRVQVPNKVALPRKKVAPHNKGLESLDPSSKGHPVLGLILGGQLRVEGLLVSRGLERLEVDSVHCVRPPS